MNAFIFLWLAAAGAGAWSLDRLIEGRRGRGSLSRRLDSWEPHARSILRVLLGFLMTLHGCRKLFGVLVSVAGRRNAPPLALDALPTWTGAFELAGGALFILGLFVRQSALVLSIEGLVAYVLVAAPRTTWPIRNGGIEALEYFVVFLYFAVAGAGDWSIDARRASSGKRQVPRREQTIAPG